jgi:hypothetical protein
MAKAKKRVMKAARPKSTGTRERSTNKRGAATMGTEPGAPPESVKAKQAWMFSSNADFVYVPESTTWPEFRDGSTSLLRFHAGTMPAPALRLQIEQFAKELDGWMLRLRYGSSDAALGAIRGAVSQPKKPLAVLLRAVEANFRKA